MNLLSALAAAQKFAPVIGFVGLAVYHVAAKHDVPSALQDLEEAAVELGLPLGLATHPAPAADAPAGK